MRPARISGAGRPAADCSRPVVHSPDVICWWSSRMRIDSPGMSWRALTERSTSWSRPGTAGARLSESLSAQCRYPDSVRQISLQEKRMTLPHTVLAAVPSQTGVESHPLDNVIWHALSGRQIHFSLGDDRARRYTADVAPFAAIRDFSPASFASLLPLVPRGDRVGMFTVTPVPQTEHFEILVAKTTHQMIATRLPGR